VWLIAVDVVEPRLDVIREAFDGSADDREVFVLRHRPRSRERLNARLSAQGT
jgi:hypothetical protein